MNSHVITVYIDDMLIVAPSFSYLLSLYTLMNQFAATLGISFKASKDQGFDTPHT